MSEESACCSFALVLPGKALCPVQIIGILRAGPRSYLLIHRRLRSAEHKLDTRQAGEITAEIGVKRMDCEMCT